MTAPSVTWLGALLALLTLLLAAGAAVHERGQVIDTAQGRAELLARVLEEHATRSVETVGLALAALGETLAAEPRNATPQISQALAQSLAGLPLLRGVAVLDAGGRVLASAGVGAIDGNVDLGRLGPLPPVGRDSVGRYVPGRGLAALADGPPPAPAPPGVGFVPMLRTVDAGGRPLVILGLVNPDAIANHQQQILDDAHSAAWLADYGGRVVAATATAPVAPGGLVNELPAFESMLPRVEHGNYIGRGLRPGEQIVAFRASRTRPLVVMVESPLDTALAGWHALAYGLLAVGAAATLVIAAMTVAGRAQPAHARTRRRRW
jgi:hypothetical protein